MVEAASNDGYLLRHYKSAGVPVLGIEPALNVARVAREQHGIPTDREFFNSDSLAPNAAIGKLRPRRVPRAQRPGARAGSQRLRRGIAHLAQDDGVAVIEVPYVKDMIDALRVRHDLSRASLLLLADRARPLFRRHGLTIVDVERVADPRRHAAAVRHADGERASRRAVAAAARRRSRLGRRRWRLYQTFARPRRAAPRRHCVALLAQLKAEGKRIAAYGASAKGSTLLNYCGIGAGNARLRRRSQHGQAGSLHARHAPCEFMRRRKLLDELPTTCCC